jgi:type II secretory pathway predicted ATPase ExeA
MYRKFFGLRENPFNVNPDPRYLFLTPCTREALAGLTYGIRSRKGFISLTGEVGTGKTTLLNKLLDWLHQRQVATAFLFNSHLLSVSQLFDFILADFGIPCESRTKSQMLMHLNRWLLDRYRAGQTTVLVIDEAQNLSPVVLEEIRLLSNLETATEKLLQIVLSGQPELEEKLRQPQLRQLRQRITVHCKTMTLTLEETRGYIAERLHIAGANSEPIFSPDSVERAYMYSGGIPRVINLLCELAMINAFVDQKKPVPADAVDEAARDFQLDQIEANARPANDAGAKAVSAAELLVRELMRILDRMRRTDPLCAEPGQGKP